MRESRKTTEDRTECVGYTTSRGGFVVYDPDNVTAWIKSYASVPIEETR